MTLTIEGSGFSLEKTQDLHTHKVPTSSKYKQKYQ